MDSASAPPARSSTATSARQTGTGAVCGSIWGASRWSTGRMRDPPWAVNLESNDTCVAGSARAMPRAMISDARSEADAESARNASARNPSCGSYRAASSAEK